MKTFRQVPVLLRDGSVKRTSLCFGERISSLGEEESGDILTLPEDAVVVPGFIDEHVHGAGGCDTMDADTGALSVMAKTLAAEGTTSFLATTMTQSEENIRAALRTVKEYRDLNSEEGAELVGVHLEGPFISSAHKGAQPEEYVRKPSVALFEELQKECDCIRIVTLAPEEEGAETLIRALNEQGVVISLGHTGAKYEDVLRAVRAGATHVTHTFNAQSPLHHREIGTVGSALLLDELSCELICDGIHVSVPAMRLLLRCKGAERTILITDAMRAKGLRDGESELGGQKVFVKGGEARLPDGTLAGSVLTMNLAVKRLINEVGVPFGEAVNCATLNPARALGLENERGSIEVGKRADFAVLDADFQVLQTYRNGHCIYNNL